MKEDEGMKEHKRVKEHERRSERRRNEYKGVKGDEGMKEYVGVTEVTKNVTSSASVNHTLMTNEERRKDMQGYPRITLGYTST